MTLTRDQILNHDDLQRERVEVPEWSGEVYVRTMTGSERDAYEMRMVADRESGGVAGIHDIRATLAALTVCSEDGAPIFSLADIEALGRKSCAALDRVCEVAQRLNRLTAADIEELKKSS
jgi:hypothetical protein